MDGRRAVLGPASGSLTPKVVFIGEAPGRRGAERTRRPFDGDASGNHFARLLASAGLDRSEVFITNAVLCCPADERSNRTPTAGEIANCQEFLRQTLALLNPPVIATLGAVALRAVGRLYARSWRLSEVAGTVIDLGSEVFVPLYHPSPRVLNTHRSFEAQQRDFAVLSRWLRATSR